MRRIDDSAIQEAVDRLHAAAPGSVVILFGSRARGDSNPDSDADFLVIEPEVKARRDEVVRLLDALRPMRIPADVLVASTEVFNEWCDTPGTVYYEAKLEGKVFHASE